MYILGLSFFYHDSSAALLKDGFVLSAMQEERFSRKKHDNRFPALSIKAVLKEEGISINDVDHIAYYENPYVKFGRILASFAHAFPHGFENFFHVMRGQLGSKLWIRREIRKQTGFRGPIHFIRHHESHAASAFYPSPFDEAAFLTLDGVGEWNTATFGVGKGRTVHTMGKVDFPHSVGLLYSAFTYFAGFRVNSGEYKLMGLAPYGEAKYVRTILDHLITLKDNGMFTIHMKYFDWAVGKRMINDKFMHLFKREPRKPESALTQDDMDLASSIQEVTERAVIQMATHVKNVTGKKYLCLAGGVALNCVANGKLLRSGLFENIWIQPAAGDAGGSLGAALFLWHHILGNERPQKRSDSFFNPYLGSSYTDAAIQEFLESNHISYTAHKNIEEVTANLLADGNVVGWFQGRMEYGPRALGNRSILGHPGLPDMQKKMNLKIKFRESFRPFAPAVLEEYASEWFEGAQRSPYMLLVFPVAKEKRVETEDKRLYGIDKLNQVRSLIPAVTHVDYSARIQTVNRKENRKFYDLISHFYQKTKIPVLVNTSFNVRGEPIVRTPVEAYRCFMRTNMDYLVLGHFLLSKTAQRPVGDSAWQEESDSD